LNVAVPLMSTANPNPTRWRCVVAYDGTSFNGWQSQEGGNTVQDVIEARLKAIFGEVIRIQGSGRTDSGVHAHAQVFHFDATWRHGAEKLRKAMQSTLPRSILLKSVRAARPDFHARFSATGKIYRYHVHLGDADPFEVNYCWPLGRDLDWKAVQATAKLLRGKHDFWAFSGENDRTYETTVRHLRRLDVQRRGKRVTFTFEADGFLYKMARSLAGALVNVGIGKLKPADVAALLTTRKRVTEVVTAPPQGLFLVKVIYK
jgi:tRNA pseudouridine38-40 synthase